MPHLKKSPKALKFIDYFRVWLFNKYVQDCWMAIYACGTLHWDMGNGGGIWGWSN
jgi:hypothetical protein